MGTKLFATNGSFPNPNFTVGGISGLTADAHYNYNGLQTTFDQRLSGGMQLHLSYTYSKTLSDADEVGNAQTLRTSPTTLDPDNLGRDYALSAYDQRHTLTVNGVYTMPWDRMLNQAVTKAILGGWSLSGIYAYGSGLPFNINTGFNGH